MTQKSLSCFKAYDIRGRVPQDLNLELVRQIGLAFVAEFSLKNVCIGYDMRATSRDFSLVLANALEDAGANVTNIGLCGTEEVYHATFSQGFDGGVMITASHNPADWNGMKLVLSEARPVSSETGLLAIQERILRHDFPIAVKPGITRFQSFREEFIEHLLGCLGDTKSLAPLRIVANAGNGCAWLPVKELAPHLPCELIPLLETPDGTFPNGVPNPILPENRELTSKAVIEHKADMGLAWDGDFDRCFFFDEKGRFIEGYYLVGLLAQTLLRRHKGATIIHDPRLTWNTLEIVAKEGGRAVQCKSGHAFIKERMRQENALYGGEMSAHHYFKDFGFCDSGMLAWLLVYELMSVTGKPLSELVDECISLYPASGEINRTLTDPDACIKAILKRYEGEALNIDYLDGVSLEFADWRFNLRKSNTEPVVRLNVESRGDDELMRAKTAEILTFLE